MVVRSMMPADAPAIHGIHSACLECSLLGRYTREQITAWMTGRTPQGYLRASEAGERFFVAEENGVTVGFASWQDTQLLSAFVHPDFQGRGTGSALVSACFEDATRMGATISSVRAVSGAEPFYHRHGFQIVGSGSTSKHGVIIQDTQMHRATCEKK